VIARFFSLFGADKTETTERCLTSFAGLSDMVALAGAKQLFEEYENNLNTPLKFTKFGCIDSYY